MSGKDRNTLSKNNKLVLIFDDKPDVRKNLRERLQYKGFATILCANSIVAASSWHKHRDEISGLILDVMMAPRGLPQELCEKTDAGLLTGWIWLWYYIKKCDIACLPDSKTKIAFFSGYLDDLDKYIEGLPLENEERTFYQKVRLFPKSDPHPERDIISYFES